MSNTLVDALLENGNVEQNVGHEEEFSLEENALDRAAFFLEAIEDETRLTEAINIVRLNKDAKRNALTTRYALWIARRKNDPLYAKYAKFNGMRLEIRAAIVKKYGNVAAQRARQAVNNMGKQMPPMK